MSTIFKILLVITATCIDFIITLCLSVYHAASLRRADQIPDDLHGFLHRLNDRIMGAFMRR